MILPALSALWTSAAAPMGDHLWQSTLFVALAALLALALRRNQARVRYWIWMTASIKFLIPFSLLIALGSHLAKPHASAPVQAVMYTAVENFSQPFAEQELPAIYQAAPSQAPVSLFHLLPEIVVSLWLAGIIVVLIKWITGWIRVSLSVRKAPSLAEGPELEALRRLESSLGIRQPIRLVLSQNWMEPGIFGIFRPVLIWPEGISQHLDDRHIDSILAHEIYHARRRDNLTAVLHMLVEAVFWFHPLVWWLGTRLEEERERACDEEVMLRYKQPHIYAESILKVCKFCSESPLACVSGITGADLKARIVQIMTERVTRKLGLARKALLLVVALAVVAVPIVLGQAKATQRIMLATLNATLIPFHAAPHEMIAEEQTLSTGEIAKVLPSAGVLGQIVDPRAAPATSDGQDLGPEFEVASIRLANPGEKNGGNWVSSSGRFECHNTALRGLVRFAYGSFPRPSGDEVSGGPGWAGSDHFDVEAKVDEAQMANWSKMSDYQRIDLVKPMLRRLLVERFQLQLHTETQVKEVYALVQAKGGSKLKEVAPPPPINDDATLQQNVRDSMAQKSPKPIAGSFMMSGDAWSGNSIPVGTLLSEIAANAHLDAPLVDQTGLRGYYDFTMKVSYDKDAPLLIDQVETQLGLKAEPRKLPLKVYVIDSAGKPTIDGAEVPSTQGQAAPPVQATHPDYRFEVASIRPGPSSLPAPPGPSYTPGHFRQESTTIPGLAFQAFGKKNGFELESPQWMRSTYFAVSATIPEGATKEDLPIMIQHLLEDRFALKYHHEARQMSGYQLVVAKSGPKLAKSATPDFDGAKLSARGVEFNNGVPQFAKEVGSVDMCFGGGTGGCALHGRNRTMETLATDLARRLSVPVMDATALEGGYDYTLIFTPEPMSAPGIVVSPGGGVPITALPDGPLDHPLLRDALREQLGLELRQVKNVPVDVVVIDSATKEPTEN